MMSCPKCGSNEIRGPRYVHGIGEREALEYWCGRCGYVEKRPTLDQRRQDEVRDRLSGAHR